MTSFTSSGSYTGVLLIIQRFLLINATSKHKLPTSSRNPYQTMPLMLILQLLAYLEFAIPLCSASCQVCMCMYYAHMY